MAYAKKMNVDIKLLARCKKIDNQVYSVVTPMMINPHHPLSNVHGVFNAILIKGNVIGDVMFYGAGAGKLPTASAVVADIVDAVKHKGKNIITKWSTSQKSLMAIDEVPSACFIRVKTLDKVGAKEVIKDIFGQVSFVEIDSLRDDLGFTTDEIKEAAIKEKLEALGQDELIDEVLSMIRIEK